MSPLLICQHSTHKRCTKFEQKCGKTDNGKQGEGEGIDNLKATLTKRLSQMVLKHNRTNHLRFVFFGLLFQAFFNDALFCFILQLFCFFFVMYDQNGLIHNQWDTLHNDNRKIDRYYGLRYHLCNNDTFEILIRYLMAPQRACSTKSWLYSRCCDLQKGTFIGTIKLDVIQYTKWYDNLLFQCF